MLIRAYQSADTETLVAVFRDAVVGTGSTAYDPQQIAVWSSYPDDLEKFRQQLSSGVTLVAVVEERPVAFGQLEAPDHIAFLYTASPFNRQGLGTEIYLRLEAQALDWGVFQLRTEASRISKHFFLKMGFEVVEAEWVDRKGIQIERFRMRKILASPKVE